MLPAGRCSVEVKLPILVFDRHQFSGYSRMERGWKKQVIELAAQNCKANNYNILIMHNVIVKIL